MAKKKTLKRKKCRWCKEWFQPWSSLQVTCQPVPCAVEYAKEKEKQKQTKAERRERKIIARRKKEFYQNDKKTRKKAAKHYFNKYIRLRDRNKPCISCGAEPGTFKLTCGHFITAGTCTALEFDELNCHGQCWFNCNKNKSGNIVEYRKGLRERFGEKRGQEILDYLEGPQPTINITPEWYKSIEDEYKEKCKKLEIVAGILRETEAA